MLKSKIVFGFEFLIGALLLVGCGKEQECKVVSLPAVPQVYGTLEEMKCPSGQLLDRVVPRILPGGIVTSYTGYCVRSEIGCK